MPRTSSDSGGASARELRNLPAGDIRCAAEPVSGAQAVEVVLRHLPVVKARRAFPITTRTPAAKVVRCSDTMAVFRLGASPESGVTA